jgi:hypothetical protein
MKKMMFVFIVFIMSSNIYADCRLPLVGDIQVAMNLRIRLDEKIGKKRKYSEFMAMSENWKSTENQLSKLVQVPLVPLYVVIDMMVAPIIPFDNAYSWFVNKGVETRKAWYEKVSPGWDKKHIENKGRMLALILQAYQGKGSFLSKISKKAGRSVKETVRLVKLHNAVGFKLCRDPQLSLDDFSKILKKNEAPSSNQY